jgi:four helix bundle protein
VRDEAQIRSHKDLAVWRKSMDLARDIYRLADVLPKKEEYRLTAQITRAALSIPANIAEGNARGTRKDYANFVSIARGSAAELETLLLIALEANLAPDPEVRPLLARTEDISRMPNALRRSLSASAPSKSLVPSP